MRLNATRLGSIASSRSFGDQLDDLAGQVPGLDLNFAQNKSLIDDYSGTTLVTFTRASSGTFVGSDGLIKTAVTNLLLRSEEFNDAAWTKTTSTVSSNVIVAPNGTLTSDKFIEGSGSVTPILAQAVSVTSGASYTFTVYAKEDLTSAKRYLTLLLPSAQFGSNVRVTFNLANGTSVSTNNPDATSIIFVGDGWYRCSVTEAATSTGSAGVQIRVSNASPDTLLSYTGDGTSGLFIWGAQLEQASTVGEYVPTVAAINSAPRFDHNPTTGESLGLLVEEARTNLSLYSEDFSDAYWTKTDCTITANDSTAPDGTTTADLWTNILSSGGTINNSITKDGNIRTYTVTMWAKGTTSLFTITLDFGGNTNRGRAQFNLATNTVVGTTNTGNFTGTSASITAYPGGWARLTMTTTTSTGTTIRFRPFFGTGGESVYIWGAQVEEGAFATSYIPTVAATVTRAADVASITGSNFSSFYNQTEGTVFSSFRRISYTGTSTVVSINDNTTNNRLYNLRQDTAAALTVISATAGSVDASPSLTLSSGAFADQVAVAQQLNNFGASANGGTVATDSTVLMPTVTQANIGNVTSSSFFNGTIKRLTYWPVRLANTTLQAISQP